MIPKIEEIRLPVLVKRSCQMDSDTDSDSKTESGIIDNMQVSDSSQLNDNALKLFHRPLSSLNDSVTDESEHCLERNNRISSLREDLQSICVKVGFTMGDLHVDNFMAGGVQQYLNRINNEQGKNTPSSNIELTQWDNLIQKQPVRTSSIATFSSFPVYVKLHILSFLKAEDLCRLSGVNKEWSELTSDNVLWGNLLERDMRDWQVIGHSTNPAIYREVESDWSNKEIYLQCCPNLRKMIRRDNLAFMNISTMLRSLWPKKAPKIAMFGPGLETKTSGIVIKMIGGDLFELKRMFPGQFEGVGSGMKLQMQNGMNFDLSILYSSTKTERENRCANRMLRSRLVQKNADDVEAAKEEDVVYELTSAVRDLCRTLDAFIYVVDATQNTQSDNLTSLELFAMVNERWSATHVPVLVLSCITDSSQPRIPCVQVANSLQLKTLDKPWQVHDCVVDSLSGVVPALCWLIEQSQRR